MTTIDDSNTTPPGYWFGEIEARLRSRMRDELRELGLRRSDWRILHLLAEGPASAEALAARLPRGRRGHAAHHGERGRPEHPAPHGQEHHGHAHQGQAHGRPDCAGADHGRGHGYGRGYGYAPEHAHDHDHDRAQHGEAAFERGFVSGFERGVRFHRPPFGPFGPVPPFGRGHGPGRGHRRPVMVDRVLAGFVERGWVWFDGDRATLTDEGRAAHDAAVERVQRVRSTLTDGIGEQDVATTLATLQAMARNLGWAPGDDAGAPPTSQGGDGGADDPETGTDR